MTLRLTDQLPGGKNRIRNTRTGHRYPDQRFAAWRREALFELKPQLRGVPGLPYCGPVKLTVWYRPQDHRRRDLPGMLDALLHLLEQAAVVVDDSQVVLLDWRRGRPLNWKPSYPDACIWMDLEFCA